MDIFDCMRNRRSVRAYLDVPVEWEKVGQVITMAKHAPSAGNQQNWKFIVVLDREKRAAISEA